MSLSLEPGAIFATDFRIVRPLGAGGMGAIYVVEQLSTGSQRALKLMHAQLLSDPKLRERFLQEARVGSKIASDHIVQVIAAGVDQTHNVPWLVMELLQGEELHDRVKREGPLPPRDVAEILRQLGHALSAAHAVGVVHRDLKPNNLFLCRARVAGSSFLLKVLDFGIAKVIAEAQTSGTSGLGTPLWMAPEQTESRSHVGPGTDIWALGLLAYWMLTGEVYWASAAAGSTSVHSVLREMLMEPIVAPSLRARDRGRANLLPPGFDAWFLHCVERSLERRFQSVDLAISELLAVLEGRAREPQVAAANPAYATVASAPLSAAMQTPGGFSAAQTGQGRPQAAAPLTDSARQSGPAGQSWAGPPQAAEAPRAQSSAATPAGFVTPGYASPGPAPALARKSGGGLVIGIVVGALALVGIGGAIGYSKWDADHERQQAKRRRDDDDDTPRRKSKKKAESPGGDEDEKPSKAVQCEQVITTITKHRSEIETAAVPNPSAAQLRDIALLLDNTAKDVSDLPVSDAELKKDVEEYASMSRDAARSMRGAADATDSNNAAGLVKYGGELEGIDKRESAISASIGLYCAPP